MEVLLPCDDLYMRSVITQRPSHDCPSYMKLGFAIEKQIALLLKHEIEYHAYLEQVKRSLRSRADWSDMRAFQTIDSRGEGVLNFNNIMNFCRLNGFRATESQVIAIVRRLDEDADQFITFDEWSEMMEDQGELEPAIHGGGPEKQDPYFFHTSPAKSYQTRASPRRGASAGFAASQLAHSASSHAIQTRDAYYGGRHRESPLRASPPRQSDSASFARDRDERAQTARASASAASARGVACATCQAQQQQQQQRAAALESAASYRASAMSQRRPDSPLRRNNASPPRATSQAAVAEAEHIKVCAHCRRPCGCNGLCHALGQPRGQTDELPYGSGAQSHRHGAAFGEDQHRSSAAQMSGGGMRREEEVELVAAFSEYIRLELELDEAKCRLAQQADFNLTDAFHMLDKFNKGSVTAAEILEALGDLGSFPHKDDVYLLVRRYDRDGDGRILYSDFCDAFTPTCESVARDLLRRPAFHVQHGYCRTHFFGHETRGMLLSAFRTHFSVEEQAEQLRQRLQRRPGFRAHDCFQALDWNSNGYLCVDEIRRVMVNNGASASELDMQMMLMRFDKSKDGRISYAEFTDELVPKCLNMK